jgi:hypothetical protein
MASDVGLSHLPEINTLDGEGGGIRTRVCQNIVRVIVNNT